MGAFAGDLAVTAVCNVALDGSAEDWVIRAGVVAVSLGFSFGVYLRGFDFFFSPEADPD